MKNLKKIIAIVLCLTFMFALAACGKTETKDDKKDDKKTKEVVKVIDISLTEEEYGFGVAKDDTELLASLNKFFDDAKADGSLEKIVNKYMDNKEDEWVGVKSATEDKSKDQIVVATSPDFPPFEDKKGEMYFGIDMELVKAYADSVNKELVIKDVNFDAVLENVNSGYADIAASGLTKNAAREKLVTFTNTYYEVPQYVVVKADDTTFDACKTKEDVDKILNSFDSKVIIGGQTGTTGVEYVVGNADFDFPGFKATSKAYDNGTQAVQDMVNGNINYVIIDGPTALAIAANMNKMAG